MIVKNNLKSFSLKYRGPNKLDTGMGLPYRIVTIKFD